MSSLQYQFDKHRWDMLLQLKPLGGMDLYSSRYSSQSWHGVYAGQERGFSGDLTGPMSFAAHSLIRVGQNAQYPNKGVLRKCNDRPQHRTFGKFLKTTMKTPA